MPELRIGVTMRAGARLWLALAALALLLRAPGARGAHHLRRSMPSPATLPLSKGGWRPVLSSGLSGYGPFQAAPLHAPSYKSQEHHPAHHPTSSRPISIRDTTKMSSPYPRPTTRSLPTLQPINTYFNPFSLPNSGYSNYKLLQNFPENVIVRNPQHQYSAYSARPVYKYPTKFKQPYHNSVLNVPPVHFTLPGYPKGGEVYGKPVDIFVRPTDAAKKPAGAEVYKPEVYKAEVYKPEVYKLDSEPALSVSQQVKTAQQQQGVPPSLKPDISYPQYQYKDERFAPLPPSILGSFTSFGVQSLKGREPVYQPTKPAFYPVTATKQTLFNSYSFAPFYKNSPGLLPATTPKFQNQFQHQFQNPVQYQSPAPQHQTQPPKPAPTKPAEPEQENFKPSPQDPFTKNYQPEVSTYNPKLQSSTAADSYYLGNTRYPLQQPQPQPPQVVQQSYYTQQNFNQEHKKQKIHDSFPASVNHQSAFPEPPRVEATANSLPAPATYEVTEPSEGDITHASVDGWSAVPDARDQLSTARATELPEELSIVTEADKGYENSLSYDSDVETQSRRPLGDDFEPIGKHKLKEYYYRVSTPAHEEFVPKKKKPGHSHNEHEVSTPKSNDVEALPTLPPNKHFKRPNSQEPLDKEKIRKRIKNRRRRPPLANINKDREESNTRKYTTAAPSADEDLSVKPRVRLPKPKTTTPTSSTDLSTSALPTVTPTSPTKKKAVHRRPSTTTDRFESSTATYKDNDYNESPIMKIATRPQHPRVTTASYSYRPSDTPDYTHKQDEKDTPADDVSVSITESMRTKPEPPKQFSFHKDVKPLEAHAEPVRSSTESLRREEEFTTTTTRTDNSSDTKRPRLKSKFESRPKFSVKEYRNRLSSTTTTSEKPPESVAPKLRFPQRRPYESKFSGDSDNSTDRKKFTPKEPRHKQGEGELETTPRQTTRKLPEVSEPPAQKISARIRNGSRRPRPTEEAPESSSPTTVHVKRPLRKKIKDSDTGESMPDVSVSETTAHYDERTSTSERSRSESAIMKIAKDDKRHQSESIDHIFEHSKRVSDLTLAASKDYNNPGVFKTVSPTSRRIPSYFTIATDDPILPIEAFFPQLNQKKES